MKLGRRGEGGFMESILAMMVIVITLTVFLSFLAFSTSPHHEKGTEIPADIFDDVRIVNGNIEADIGEMMTDTIERYGYRGMRVILTATGMYDSSITLNAGTNDSDNIFSKNGTIIVRSDDGRSVPVNYSVAVWS
jgi:uncharacterized membrane protein